MPYSDYPAFRMSETEATTALDCIELSGGEYVAIWEESGGVKIAFVDFSAESVANVSYVFEASDLPNPAMLLIDCFLVVPKSGGVAVAWLMFVSGGDSYLCSRFYDSGLSPDGGPNFTVLPNTVTGGGIGPSLSAVRSSDIASELSCVVRVTDGAQPVLAGCHVASNGSLSSYAVIIAADAPELPTGSDGNLTSPMILRSNDGGTTYPLAFDHVTYTAPDVAVWGCYTVRVTNGFTLAGALLPILATTDANTSTLKVPWPAGNSDGLVMIDEGDEANAWIISPVNVLDMQSDFLTIMPFIFGGNTDPRSVAVSSGLDIAVSAGGPLVAHAATGYGTYTEWLPGSAETSATIAALAYTGDTPAGVGFELVGFEPATSFAAAQRFALIPTPPATYTPVPLNMAGFRLVPLMCAPCNPILWNDATQSWFNVY